MVAIGPLGNGHHLRFPFPSDSVHRLHHVAADHLSSPPSLPLPIPLLPLRLPPLSSSPLLPPLPSPRPILPLRRLGRPPRPTTATGEAEKRRGVGKEAEGGGGEEEERAGGEGVDGEGGERGAGERNADGEGGTATVTTEAGTSPPSSSLSLSH